MDEQLHEEIARKFIEYDTTRHDVGPEGMADEVLALIEAAGWKSGEEVYNQTMKAKRSGWNDCMLSQKAEGYVKLSDDQLFPENPFNSTEMREGCHWGQQRMYNANWRRVILEEII